MSEYASRRWRQALWLLTVILCRPVHGDGFGIDKVYHPYVQPLERELEIRSLFITDDDDTIDGFQSHRIGLGRSFSDRVFGEFYLIGEKESSGSLSLEAYELELKWQLTEQGEYFADWGLLFEFETERDVDVQEFATTVLTEKELGRWVGTLNLSAIYEWGDDIENELESSLAAQLRYRYSRLFEPAVELYAAQNTRGAGPVMIGDIRLGGPRKLHWEIGLILGLDQDTPEQTFRALLELEF